MLEPLRNLNITEPHFVSPFFSLCLLLLEEVVPHLPLPLSLARLIGSVLFWPENVNFFLSARGKSHLNIVSITPLSLCLSMSLSLDSWPLLYYSLYYVVLYPKYSLCYVLVCVCVPFSNNSWRGTFIQWLFLMAFSVFLSFCCRIWLDGIYCSCLLQHLAWVNYTDWGNPHH